MQTGNPIPAPYAPAVRSGEPDPVSLANSTFMAIVDRSDIRTAEGLTSYPRRCRQRMPLTVDDVGAV